MDGSAGSEAEKGSKKQQRSFVVHLNRSFDGRNLREKLRLRFVFSLKPHLPVRLRPNHQIHKSPNLQIHGSLQILFEDHDLLVIHKPSGLSSESGTARHPSAEREALALLSKKILGDDVGGMRMKVSPYLRAVHRLDRASSGVLVMAKSKTALTILMHQFERREVEKTYQAVVEKAPPAASGILTHWLKRDETGKKALIFKKLMPDTQPCESAYKVLEMHGEQALLEIRPSTGRFHQIRAQLAYIGCPIVGDVLYGGQFWREHEIKLHAQRLAFAHPRSEVPMVIEAPWQWQV